MPLSSTGLCDADITAPPRPFSSKRKRGAGGGAPPPGGGAPPPPRQKAGDKRTFEHRPGHARVAPDDHLAVAAKRVARCPAECQREVGREVAVGDSSDSVGAEQPCHGLILT